METTREVAAPRGRRAADRRFHAYAFMLGTTAAIAALAPIVNAPAELVDQAAPIAVFGLLIALSWYWSVPLFKQSHLSFSLDMAYMLTALAVLQGPMPLAVALFGGVLGCVLRQFDPETRATPFWPVVALNAGALASAACVGGLVAERLAPRWPVRHLDWATVGTILLLYAAYSLTNLVVMGGAIIFRGESVLPTLASYLAYIPTLEILAIPLALGLALLYAGAGIWGFAPLGGTILVASALLRRLNRAREDLNRANEKLRSRSSELSTLNSIGAAISSTLDPQQVFARAAENLPRVLEAPHLFLSLRKRGAAEPYSEFIARDGVVITVFDGPRGHVFTHWMLTERRPLMLDDLKDQRTTLPCPPVLLDPSSRSLMAVPLVASGEAIGTMSVESPRPHAYTMDQLAVLNTVAQQVAVAIENARHYQQATVDQLTQLYLRDFFLRQLTEEQARARRYGSEFAVLVLDLDRFKEINDRLGHLAGDRFLQRVGDVVRQTMRSADIPCRWGGEEFCVLLPETDREGALAMAERLRESIAGLAMPVGEDTLVRTTVSIGVACHPKDDPGTARGFIERADAALYQAK
ncbi:MAG TPA: sensor domain-containing diguanylate cyclase, partial [Candidatus Polarisedimenticolia bacterium]|nr:sensor domain-containing diguanylate cyclase [Candidatus Polarisedimenticolia bacterium]